MRADKAILAVLLAAFSLGQAPGWAADEAHENGNGAPQELPLWAENLNAFAKQSDKKLAQLLARKDEVAGFELIIAGSGSRQIFSQFGHALLRFVMKENLDDPYGWTEDPVLSFVALVDDPVISYRKGIFSGYKLFPQIGKFNEFWEEYILNETRSLDRYVLPTNKSMRLHFMNTLQKEVEDPERLGQYSFFSRNCGRKLGQVFNEASFASGGVPLIPMNLPDFFTKNLINPYPVLRMDSPLPVLEKSAKLLEISLDDLRFGRNWPADSAKRLLGGLTPFEIRVFYQNFLIGTMPLEVFQEMIAVQNYRHNKSVNETLGFKPVDASLYDLCEDLSCARNVLSVMNKTWSRKEIRDSIATHRQTARFLPTKDADLVKRLLSLEPAATRHLFLLDEAERTQ